jgi:hypothetical protein
MKYPFYLDQHSRKRSTFREKTAHPCGEVPSPRNVAPMCRIGGKCAAFRAKTVEVSGHLPSASLHHPDALLSIQERFARVL